MSRSKAFGKVSETNQSPRNGPFRAAADICDSLVAKQQPRRAHLVLVRCGRPDVTTETLGITRERKPLPRRLAGHGRLGWAARPNSIDAVTTLVAVSSSKPANVLASLEPAEVRTPSRR